MDSNLMQFPPGNGPYTGPNSNPNSGINYRGGNTPPTSSSGGNPIHPTPPSTPGHNRPSGSSLPPDAGTPTSMGMMDARIMNNPGNPMHPFYSQHGPMPPHHPGMISGPGPIHPPHAMPPHMHRMASMFSQLPPDHRIHDMNKRLQYRPEENDILWWDTFATEFFEDDATLTLHFLMEDGPKRYTIGRVLIPRYFRTIFESGCCELYYVLRCPRDNFQHTHLIVDSEATDMVMNMTRPFPISVIAEGRLILEFTCDELMRIRNWVFIIRSHRELLFRNMLGVPDPAFLENLSKNITRNGMTAQTLNFLRLCVILEPMQELMSRQKAYSLTPRDCLKTTLFQKWQRIVAPPDTTRTTNKRRKRKTNTSGSDAGSKHSKRKQSPIPALQTMTAPGDVMVVGEPTLMGGNFGDEDERMITRLENVNFSSSMSSTTGQLGQSMVSTPSQQHSNASMLMSPSQQTTSTAQSSNITSNTSTINTSSGVRHTGISTVSSSSSNNSTTIISTIASSTSMSSNSFVGHTSNNNMNFSRQDSCGNNNGGPTSVKSEQLSRFEAMSNADLNEAPSSVQTLMNSSNNNNNNNTTATAGSVSDLADERAASTGAASAAFIDEKPDIFNTNQDGFMNSMSRSNSHGSTGQGSTNNNNTHNNNNNNKGSTTSLSHSMSTENLGGSQSAPLPALSHMVSMGSVKMEQMNNNTPPSVMASQAATAINQMGGRPMMQPHHPGMMIPNESHCNRPMNIMQPHPPPPMGHPSMSNIQGPPQHHPGFHPGLPPHPNMMMRPGNFIPPGSGAPPPPHHPMYGLMAMGGMPTPGGPPVHMGMMYGSPYPQQFQPPMHPSGNVGPFHSASRP